MSMHSSWRRKDPKVDKQTPGQRRSAARKKARKRENQQRLADEAKRRGISILSTKRALFREYWATGKTRNRGPVHSSLSGVGRDPFGSTYSDTHGYGGGIRHGLKYVP